MRTEDNFGIWSFLLDDWDESSQLWIVDHDYASIKSSIAPETLIVLLSPKLEPGLIRLVDLHFFGRNTLKDVMELGLGDIKHRRMAFGDEPFDREADHSPESEEGMSHEGDTSTLGSG